MRCIICGFIAMIGLFFLQPFAGAKTLDTTAYNFSFTTLISEKPMPIKQFEGKVILIVHTTSHCGFTPQYKDLEKFNALAEGS